MRLNKLGQNQNLLETNHGHEILYSYNCPVAGFSPGIGYFKTTKFYSTTTSKHINKYLEGIENVSTINQEDIELMGWLI